MRVLYVVDEFPVLSQTFVTDEIAERRRQGDDVDVLAMWPKGPGARPVLGVFGRLATLRAVGLSLLVRPRAVLRARRLARTAHPDERAEVPWGQLVAHARTFAAYDVVHAHFGWSAAVRAEALAGLLGVPWALTLHGRDVHGGPRDLARKVAAADLAVTVCASFAAYLEEVSGRPVAEVPCGVRTDVVPASDPDTDVVVVGRLVPKKGVDVLLAAVRGTPTTVDVVGDGPLRDELRRASGPAVRFAGALDHDATRERIRRARVCVVPSRIAPDGDRDSMPLVAKEAMAAGVPVVVSAVEGLTELVDETCGWVVPPEDPTALGAAIAAALADGGRRAEAGRRRVAEQALERTVGRLRTLSDACVREGRPTTVTPWSSPRR